MTGDVSDILEQLKVRARDAMRDGDYAGALDVLDQALDLLADAHNDAHTLGPAQVRRELAACYGMMGNIYRRLGDLLSALEMFEHGADYEDGTHENRVNAIVLALLIDPAGYPAVRPVINETLPLLQRQIAGRSPDQWLWSDLGLLRLLSGDYAGALAAFDQVAHIPDALYSLDKMLGMLCEALVPHQPDIAAALASARAELFE